MDSIPLHTHAQKCLLHPATGEQKKQYLHWSHRRGRTNKIFISEQKMISGQRGSRDCPSYDRCPLRYLAMPKARIFSLPKIGSIFLSGLKNCLFSGSWSFFSLM